MTKKFFHFLSILLFFSITVIAQEEVKKDSVEYIYKNKNKFNGPNSIAEILKLDNNSEILSTKNNLFKDNIYYKILECENRYVDYKDILYTCKLNDDEYYVSMLDSRLNGEEFLDFCATLKLENTKKHFNLSDGKICLKSIRISEHESNDVTYLADAKKSVYLDTFKEYAIFMNQDLSLFLSKNVHVAHDYELERFNNGSYSDFYYTQILRRFKFDSNILNQYSRLLSEHNFKDENIFNELFNSDKIKKLKNKLELNISKDIFNHIKEDFILYKDEEWHTEGGKIEELYPHLVIRKKNAKEGFYCKKPGPYKKRYKNNFDSEYELNMIDDNKYYNIDLKLPEEFIETKDNIYIKTENVFKYLIKVPRKEVDRLHDRARYAGPGYYNYFIGTNGYNLHYAGTLLGIGISFSAIIAQEPFLALIGLLTAYGLAWFGHFTIEKNQPAAFKKPILSFLYNFKMLWLWLKGEVDAEFEAAVRAKEQA